MDLQAEKIELVKLLFETQKESLIKKSKALLKEDNGLLLNYLNLKRKS